WSSPVARQAHNLKVVGSNPTPAPKNTLKIKKAPPTGGAFSLLIHDLPLSAVALRWYSRVEILRLRRAPVSAAVFAGHAAGGAAIRCDETMRLYDERSRNCCWRKAFSLLLV
ncbi:MAG TPA: hypothetical protein PKY87_15005, partial [Terricaulis sp.]|nr:hypothetical protein [Terricaulis sp.]